MVFKGVVTLVSPEGKSVALWAAADSCAAEELMPDYCRVKESDEGNNSSASLQVKLP